jgi:hypothetical protein
MDKPILPPGKHPMDSLNQDVDPVARQLERIQIFLLWIDEHRSSFEKIRDTDPAAAKSELGYLKDSTEQLVLHVERLTELLLAGHTIDAKKRLPKDFLLEPWLRWVKIVQEERSQKPKESKLG